nr:unnamed protein product [Callosobruchus analis]
MNSSLRVFLLLIKIKNSFNFIATIIYYIYVTNKKSALNFKHTSTICALNFDPDLLYGSSLKHRLKLNPLKSSSGY